MEKEQSIIMKRCGSFTPVGRRPPTLVEMPLDLIVLISGSFLSHISVLTLSLTCKSMYYNLFFEYRHELENSSRNELLSLLEKDARHHYFCHYCVRLHSFDPTNELSISSDYTKGLARDDCRYTCFRLYGTGFRIGYHHVRLVMNRHFYGTSRGLPLSVFNVTYQTEYPIQLPWTIKCSARVIDDELFFSYTHKLRLRETEENLRHMIDSCTHQICTHVGTKNERHNFMDPASSEAHLDEVTRRCTINAFRPERNADYKLPVIYRGLKQCRDVTGLCDYCPTDYTTTLEKGNGEEGLKCKPEWNLTIVTYHQVGSCRSPFDDKWVSFRTIPEEVGPKLRQERFGILPGDVRKKWEESTQSSATYM